jgi:hypothetical protein
MCGLLSVNKRADNVIVSLPLLEFSGLTAGFLRQGFLYPSRKQKAEIPKNPGPYEPRSEKLRCYGPSEPCSGLIAVERKCTSSIWPRRIGASCCGPSMR